MAPKRIAADSEEEEDEAFKNESDFNASDTGDSSDNFSEASDFEQKKPAAAKKKTPAAVKAAKPAAQKKTPAKPKKKTANSD